MTQYGTASVYGVDGTVTISGSALAAFVDSFEGEHDVQIDEFMSGFGELIGFRKHDERERVDLIIVPKKTAASGSLNDALKALAYPASPVKVTLTNVPDTDTAGGHSANEIGHNTDYIYTRGARRTMVEGRAALRMPIFRPKTSPLTVDQLVAQCT